MNDSFTNSECFCEESNIFVYEEGISIISNLDEAIEQDEFNDLKILANKYFSEDKENIPEFENNMMKGEINKEKPFNNFNPNIDNSNSYFPFFDDNSKISHISYSSYDPDSEKSKYFFNFRNKDSSSFSNKKRGRSPKFEKDLKNNQANIMNHSEDVIYKKKKIIYLI